MSAAPIFATNDTSMILRLLAVSIVALTTQATTCKKSVPKSDTVVADSLTPVIMDTALPQDNRKHPPALPIEPTYPEGRLALEQFIAKNTIYPEAAQKAGITGQVIVGFIVKKDGSLSDFKLWKGLGYGCDEEAMRVARLMPNWNPGKKDGVDVDMEYQIYVPFPPVKK